MGSSSSVQFLFMLSLVLVIGANAQLTPNFYGQSCPNLGTIVRDVMRQTVVREPRMAASILRLFFHDCFVQVKHASLFTMLG